MGFWGSFLGYSAAKAISESNKEVKRHNDLCYQLSSYNAELDEYLKKVGCKALYIADYGCIDTGNISNEKRKMDTIKCKIDEYMKIGGNPQYIHDLAELDSCIEKVKYLQSKQCINRQQEFEYDELCWIKDILEREAEEREFEQNRKKFLESGKESLLQAQSNDLDSITEKCIEKNTSDVTIDFAQVLTSDIANSFLENDDIDYDIDLLTVKIVLEPQKITLYDWVSLSKAYYSHEVKPNEYIHIEYTPFSDGSVSIVKFKELILYMPVRDAEKFKNYYKNESNKLSIDTINTMSGIEFENICQKLVEKMGFETETTKASGDGGIDLIAYNHQPLLSGKYIIQCKRYAGTVGEPIIRDLYGVITSERANKGILMTTGHFTQSAITFANGKQIELIDGDNIQKLLLEYGFFH